MMHVTYTVIQAGKTADAVRVGDCVIPVKAKYQVRRYKSDERDDPWFMLDWQWKEGNVHLGMFFTPRSQIQLEDVLRQMAGEDAVAEVLQAL